MNGLKQKLIPTLIVNVDGNFDGSVLINQNQLGTVWNNWETQWSGVVSRTRDVTKRTWWIFQRTITNTRSDQVRTGTRTRIVEQVENQVIVKELLDLKLN